MSTSTFVVPSLNPCALLDIGIRMVLQTRSHILWQMWSVAGSSSRDWENKESLFLLKEIELVSSWMCDVRKEE